MEMCVIIITDFFHCSQFVRSKLNGAAGKGTQKFNQIILRKLVPISNIHSTEHQPLIQSDRF